MNFIKNKLAEVRTTELNELYNKIEYNFSILIKKYGKLKYKIVEHPIINNADNIITQKILIKALKENEYICLIKDTLYSALLNKENTKDINVDILKNLVELDIFKEGTLWVKLDKHSKMRYNDNLKDYFDNPFIHLALLKGMEIPNIPKEYRNLTGMNKFLNIISSNFTYEDRSVVYRLKTFLTLKRG